MHLVATGALTNVALLTMLYPEVVGMIEVRSRASCRILTHASLRISCLKPAFRCGKVQQLMLTPLLQQITIMGGCMGVGEAQAALLSAKCTFVFLKRGLQIHEAV